MAEKPHTTFSPSRRVLLAGAALLAAPLPVAASPNPAAPEDLTRYYAFLWREYRALSQEMGVDMGDATTANRHGDNETLAAHLTAAPSTRALPALKALGLDRDTLPSVGAWPEKPADYREPEVSLETYLGFLQAEVRNTLRAMGKGTRESDMPIGWCPPAPKVHGTVESRARAILAREALA